MRPRWRAGAGDDDEARAADVVVEMAVALRGLLQGHAELLERRKLWTNGDAGPSVAFLKLCGTRGGNAIPGARGCHPTCGGMAEL